MASMTLNEIFNDFSLPTDIQNLKPDQIKFQCLPGHNQGNTVTHLQRSLFVTIIVYNMRIISIHIHIPWKLA